jgi:hypothetical protein
MTRVEEWSRKEIGARIANKRVSGAVIGILDPKMMVRL